MRSPCDLLFETSFTFSCGVFRMRLSPCKDLSLLSQVRTSPHASTNPCHDCNSVLAAETSPVNKKLPLGCISVGRLGAYLRLHRVVLLATTLDRMAMAEKGENGCKDRLLDAPHPCVG